MKVWNTTNFDVVLANVGKVRAKACTDVPSMSPQLQQLLDSGFLTLTEPVVPKPAAPEKKITVDVGIMTVEVSAGADQELGTPDDVVKIKAKPKSRKKKKKDD
jgi:hypothetical protein